MPTVITATTKDIVVKQVRVILTDEQIKNAVTSFPEIIPAPGAGKVIVVIGAIFKIDPVAGEYTNKDQYLQAALTYGGYSDATNYLPAVFFTQDKKLSVVGAISYPDSTGVNLAEQKNIEVFDNCALSFIIYNGSMGNLTGGNGANTLGIAVQYVVFDI